MQCTVWPSGDKENVCTFGSAIALRGTRAWVHGPCPLGLLVLSGLPAASRNLPCELFSLLPRLSQPWASLLLFPSVFPSIRVFSNESPLRMRWPKYWSFSFSITPSNEYSGLISFRMDWQSKGFSRVFSNTVVQKHQFISAQLSL